MKLLEKNSKKFANAFLCCHGQTNYTKNNNKNMEAIKLEVIERCQ